VVGSEAVEAAANCVLFEDLSPLWLAPLRCLFSGTLPHSGGELQAPVNRMAGLEWLVHWFFFPPNLMAYLLPTMVVIDGRVLLCAMSSGA
jgi:hypothetical protein